MRAWGTQASYLSMLAAPFLLLRVEAGLVFIGLGMGGAKNNKLLNELGL